MPKYSCSIILAFFHTVHNDMNMGSHRILDVPQEVLDTLYMPTYVGFN